MDDRFEKFLASLKPGSYTINSKVCKCMEVVDSEGNQLFFESDDSAVEQKPLKVEDPRPYGKQFPQGAAITLAEKDHIINTMRQQRNKLRSRAESRLEWAKKMYTFGKIGRITAEAILEDYNFSNRDRRLIWPLPAVVTFDEAFNA